MNPPCWNHTGAANINGASTIWLWLATRQGSADLRRVTPVDGTPGTGCARCLGLQEIGGVVESISWRWAQPGGAIGYEVTLSNLGRTGTISIVSPGHGRIAIDADAFGDLLAAMRTQKPEDGRIIRQWGDRAYVLVASDSGNPYITGLNPAFPWVNCSISELLPHEADNLTVSDALSGTALRPELGRVTVVNLLTIDARKDPQPFFEGLDVFAEAATWVYDGADMEALEVEVALKIGTRAAREDLDRVDWAETH